MDSAMIEKLADSAQERAERAHAHHSVAKTRAEDYRYASDLVLAHQKDDESAGYLNDYFYWIGHANAYRGVLAGLAIQKMVEEEGDSIPSCP